jgi:hypothetical protein
MRTRCFLSLVLAKSIMVSSVPSPMTARGAGGVATQRRLRRHIAVRVATAVSAVDRPTARSHCSAQGVVRQQYWTVLWRRGVSHASIGLLLDESVVSIGWCKGRRQRLGTVASVFQQFYSQHCQNYLCTHHYHRRRFENNHRSSSYAAPVCTAPQTHPSTSVHATGEKAITMTTFYACRKELRIPYCRSDT